MPRCRSGESLTVMGLAFDPDARMRLVTMTPGVTLAFAAAGELVLLPCCGVADAFRAVLERLVVLLMHPE